MTPGPVLYDVMICADIFLLPNDGSGCKTNNETITHSCDNASLDSDMDICSEYLFKRAGKLIKPDLMVHTT